MKDADFDISTLLYEGEAIADYTLTGMGTNWGSPVYQCVTQPGSTDIHSALEETLHRIIDARIDTGDADDVLAETMGVVRADSIDAEDGVTPIDLDLGYALPGAITSFTERAPVACDPAEPLNMTDASACGPIR
ncbi:antirestriction protein ArdA [Bifidobacterium saguini DSM 23967]|uniref:Antirestriction protein ArdA n=2 Tax=Bifidobacterium saguini TaxID=762210 RepID=A0A087D5N9_9BIFI|nr:hypothetical protein [Bifidobacterium saguini]KFI90839.1 antirestriction protein ArdA [Bifidobacterium saguini DSM 23967]QTB90746.1 hypothetical protein BSD967_10725 [Bifidobacterium saguini]